jgi:hypothetical protein
MVTSHRSWLGGFLSGVALLDSTPVFAQRLEVELKTQAAYVLVEDGDGGVFAGLGVEACAKCNDRFGLFGEYVHWARPQALPSAARGLTGMDLVGGGVRIGGGDSSRRIQSFFDVGFGIAQVRMLQPPHEHTFFGLIFGTGAVVPISSRWYVRPQFRAYWMGIYSLATSGGVGVGARF